MQKAILSSSLHIARMFKLHGYEFWTPVILNLVHYRNFIDITRRSHNLMGSHMNDGF